MISRRLFVTSLPGGLAAQVPREPGVSLRLGLNAYSFHAPLRDGSMTLLDLVRWCAQQGIPALDATGYYFPGYPEAPADDYLRDLKHLAYINGVALCGTGVRQDFANPDAAARAADIGLVKRWVEVAAKLGMPVVRVFAGRDVPDPQKYEQMFAAVTAALRECAEFAGRVGVMIGLQNHHDYLKTAAQTIRLVRAVDSRWLGVILDTGSLRQGDPYAEIGELMPFATSWQVKESIWPNGKETPIDLARLKGVIGRGSYRGYFPIETLGPGDPKVKVPAFVKRIRETFAI